MGKLEVDRLAADAGPSGPDARAPAPEPEGYENMMQKVQETIASGYLQVENDSAIVVGGRGTCWNTTVGCDCYTVLIGSRRMCRG
jgi:hypothetical protein